MKDNSLQNIENYKKDDSVVFYDERDVYMKYVNVIKMINKNFLKQLKY